MTVDQYERLSAQLDALEPEIKNLGDRSAAFVRDQLERVASYGVNVQMSVRQQAWLDDLYQKHIGPLDGLPGGAEPADRDEVLGDAGANTDPDEILF